MSAPLIQVPLDHLPRARWRGRSRRRVPAAGPRKPAPIGVIAAAGTSLILSLFGAAVLAGDIRNGDISLPALPSFAASAAPAETPGRSDPSAAALARYAGRWVTAGGTGFIIAKSGAVWMDAGRRLGQVSRDGAEALALQGEGFRCAYTVTFDNPDSSTWRLTDAASQGGCPDGKLTRPFAF